MIQIYPDRSKDPETGEIGVAIYIPQLQISIKEITSDHLTVFSVEPLVIIFGLFVS